MFHVFFYTSFLTPLCSKDRPSSGIKTLYCSEKDWQYLTANSIISHFQDPQFRLYNIDFL